MMSDDQEHQADEEVDDSAVWSEIIGPVYDRDTLQSGFGYTPEQIEVMVKEDALLELVTLDGKSFFPASGFDDRGRPVPRLSELVAKLQAQGIEDPWGLVMWLSTRPPEWDGKSAFELLRTGEWADEIITQGGEHGRSPLRARSEQLALREIARPIFDRSVELVAGFPVDIAEGTLFVTRETEVPFGVFAISFGKGPNALRAASFPIEGDPEQIANDLAAMVAEQIAEMTND